MTAAAHEANAVFLAAEARRMPEGSNLRDDLFAAAAACWRQAGLARNAQ